MPSRFVRPPVALRSNTFFAVALVLCGGATVGCSGPDDRPSLYGGTELDPLSKADSQTDVAEDAGTRVDAAVSAWEAGAAPGLCTPGARRTCLQYRGDADLGYLYCERGVEVCGDGGRWGACLLGVDENDAGTSQR